MYRARPAARIVVSAFIAAVCLRPAAAPAAVGGGDSLFVPVVVKPGWNVLSLPAVTAGVKSSLFPSSLSNAFVFDGAYAATDTLRNGRGFWMKFAAPETIMIAGTLDFLDTIPLHAGWNLIGGITTPVALDKIVEIPDFNIESAYFEYDPVAGYSHADTLKPGSGYMVKAAAAGKLVLRSIDVPCPGTTPFMYGEDVYSTVQIFDQCWLRENLRIGTMQWSGLDQTDDGVIERYCWIDDSLNCRWYGALYQWNEAMGYDTTPGGQGICPAGWHIPTSAELRHLAGWVDGNGNMLKADHRGSDEGIGTNETGFSAELPAYRHLNGSFSINGYQAYFWTSTTAPETVSRASTMYLFHQYSDIFFNSLDKNYGVSIRCLKDGSAGAQDPLLRPGAALPPILFPDTGGTPFNFRMAGAEQFLLIFYVSSCPHCRNLFDALRAPYAQRSSQTEIVTVSLDPDRQEWVEYLRAEGFQWPSVSDLLGWESPVVSALDLTGTPTMVLVDRQMRVIAVPGTVEDAVNLLK